MYRRLKRELIVILGFIGLTCIMTWPYARYWRDAVHDEGDAYAHAYFLWWGYHQTFTDPGHLFDATIFYPHFNSFAFGENDYGISLLCFPLFALGLRPLAIQGLATLAGFAFSGYGMFRLARALTKSAGVAWVAGVVFAFIPYRFNQIGHLPLVFAGWLPLLLEALILFVQKCTWRRALWLAAAFAMNALTCLTWFVLGLIPLILSGVLLIMRQRRWRDRALWLRGGAAAILALAVLLPFLLPFVRAAQAHGFTRNLGDVAGYSAQWLSWLAVDVQNRLWAGLGARVAINEVALFPGFVPPFLLLAAFLLLRRRKTGRAPGKLLLGLDVSFWLALLVALLVIGYERLQWRIGGATILLASTPAWPLIIAGLLLLARLALARPQAWQAWRRVRWREAFRRSPRFAAYAHGLLWATLGFAGSFGSNFFFHRFLFEYVPLFRSMRVAARWSMICYLGLALLAGLGASRLVALLARHAPRVGRSWGYALILLAVLFEQRTAPMNIVRGVPEPDALTLRLKETKMTAGVLELPVGEYHNLRYMLRAADHGKPLVNAISSFVPPELYEIEAATRSRQVPDSLLATLEGVPVSYLTVRYVHMTPTMRVKMGHWLARAVATGRLRFINSYPETGRNGEADSHSDLYAVTLNEPEAVSEAAPLPYFSTTDFAPYFKELPPAYGADAFAWARLYRVAYGRQVKLAELAVASDGANGEAIAGQPAFAALYKNKTNAAFVSALGANAGPTLGAEEQLTLTQQLDAGKISRAAVLQTLANHEGVLLHYFNETFVLLHYLAYLKRDPGPEEVAYWVAGLEDSLSPAQLHTAFLGSSEYLEKQTTY